MSTAAAPSLASEDRWSGIVAICGEVIPTTRSQTMIDDFRRSNIESTIFSEQRSNGFDTSVDRHSVYATILVSGRDFVRPPQSPVISTASGFGFADAPSCACKAPSALILAFIGPIPPVTRPTSFGPQRSKELELEGTPIFRMGRPSIVEAAK